jgi:hypothetical protein
MYRYGTCCGKGNAPGGARNVLPDFPLKSGTYIAARLSPFRARSKLPPFTLSGTLAQGSSGGQENLGFTPRCPLIFPGTCPELVLKFLKKSRGYPEMTGKKLGVAIFAFSRPCSPCTPFPSPQRLFCTAQRCKSMQIWYNVGVRWQNDERHVLSLYWKTLSCKPLQSAKYQMKFLTRFHFFTL